MTRVRRRALILFAVALVVRGLYLVADVDVPPQDTPDYDEIAQNLLTGDGFVARGNWFGHELRAWRAPLYPVFLAGVYGIFGPHHEAVQALQAVIGAATVVLVYLLALRLCPGAALLAGLAAAFYEPLVASANEVMTETLFTALFVGAVALAGEARRGGRWSTGLAAGVLIGLAGLTRPVGLLAAPAILAVAGWEAWQAGGAVAGRVWLRQAIPLAAGVVLALAPWAVRNGVVLGAFVPVSTHGGFIVARSNADAPDWRLRDGWRIDPGTFASVPDEVERDRRWMRQGLTWIADHPGTWLRLAGERLLRFFYVFRPAYNAAFVIILPFALVGLWRWGWAPGFRDLTAVTALSLLVFCFLLYGSTRFRLPLEPLWLVFAAAAAVDGWSRWGGWRCGRATGAWILVNGAIWIWAAPLRAGVVACLRATGLK